MPENNNIAGIIIAVAGLVVSLGTAVAAIITALIAKKAATASAETLVEAKEIKHHVNSAATESKNEIAALRREVLELTKQAAVSKEAAALLAQTASNAQAVTAHPNVPLVPTEPTPVVVVNEPLRVVPADDKT